MLDSGATLMLCYATLLTRLWLIKYMTECNVSAREVVLCLSKKNTMNTTDFNDQMLLRALEVVVLNSCWTCCSDNIPGPGMSSKVINQWHNFCVAKRPHVASLHNLQPKVCRWTAVLLWQHGGPNPDLRFHRWEHPRQGTWLGIPPIPETPQDSRSFPLGLRRPQLLLLLPVVRQLSLLFHTPAIEWLQDI